jgi:hypothetical protein
MRNQRMGRIWNLCKHIVCRGGEHLLRLVRDGQRPTPSAAPAPVEKVASVSSPSLIALFRDLSLFAAVFAYLAGWQYIRSYYKQFEIDPAVMDIAINSYFVYAFFALFNPWGGALIGVFAFASFVWNRVGARKVIHVITLAAFAFGVFWVASNRGTEAGRRLRLEFQGLPAVDFAFKDAAFQSRVTANPAWTGTWFLVAATKDKFLVLAQDPPDPAFPGRLPAATTILIPAAEVAAGVRVKDLQR